jgi:hypothetical protein
MTSMTRDRIWDALRQSALVEGEMPAPGTARSPWFVRAMLGVAGWIGAWFLLGFVALGLVAVVKSPTASWLVGAGACAAVAMLFRANRDGDFASQFGLAVSLAGQALMVYGLTEWVGRSFTAVALGVAAQQALLFLLLPNFVHRVWSAWTGAYAMSFALADMGLHAFAPAAVTAGFIVVWLREFDYPARGELIRAGGYGLALAAVQTAVMHGSLWYGWIATLGGRVPAGSVALAWAGAVVAGAVLVGAVVLLLRREQVALDSGPGRVALAAATVLALASLKAPGVGPAVAILAVGYANGNRVLAGLGIAALIGYLSHYYYALHATLLEKSVLMACAGIGLLAARFALHRWWPEQKEVTHA